MSKILFYQNNLKVLEKLYFEFDCPDCFFVDLILLASPDRKIVPAPMR